jgi:methylated-DNA-[protein]-cysteine S-methyltransferase
MKMTYTVFRVQLGWVGLVGSEKGVRRIILPGLEKEELRQRILRDFPGSREGSDHLQEAQKELVEYFAGKRKDFRFPLDLSEVTPFRKRVYEVMAQIPFGEFHTYRWLAEKAGNPRALRAVGGANANNDWPIVIPCHRIVGCDGRLTGFSAPGGLQLKAELLGLEGIAVQNNKVTWQEVKA